MSHAIIKNAVKAVEATKNRLRAERGPKLEALDVEYQRADEAGDQQKKQAIAQKKQQLRDVTATVPTPPAGMVAATEDFLQQLRAVQLPAV